MELDQARVPRREATRHIFKNFAGEGQIACIYMQELYRILDDTDTDVKLCMWYFWVS